MNRTATHLLRMLRFGLMAGVALGGGLARADDKAACIEAASRGQALRDGHKLVEAREPLRACSDLRCPAAVRSDCAGWLADVDKSLPTVVLSARSGAGANLIEVKVSVDGQPLATRLDGEALPTNPGLRTFHFEGPDGTAIDQQVVVREGERNQAIAVVLGPAPAPAPPAAVPAPTVAAPPAAPAAAPPPADAAPGGSSGNWMTPTGWVVAGAGVVGLGLGVAFGLVSMGDKNGAHCDASNFCDPSALSSGRSAATVADVGFIAGGVLVAGGLALVLMAPGGHRESPTAVRLAPMLSASAQGASLGGAW